MLKKILPTVLVIAVLWPFGIGLFGKHIYQGMDYHDLNVNITTEDYQQGYLSAQQTLKVQALGAFKQQLIDAHIPTEWTLNNKIHHGFLQVSSELQVSLNNAIKQKILALWSTKQLPWSITSHISLFGNGGFQLSLAALKKTFDSNLQIQSAPLTLSGTINTSKQQITTQLHYPKFSMTSSKSSAIFSIDNVSGHSLLQNTNGHFWLGDSTVQFEKIRLYSDTKPANTAPEIYLNGLTLGTHSELNEEKSTINTDITAKIDDANISPQLSFSKVFAHVGLQDLDFVALSKIAGPLPTDQQKQQHQAFKQLLKKGFSFIAKSEALDNTGKQQMLASNLLLILAASEKPLSIATIVSKISGSAHFNLMQSLVDTTPFRPFFIRCVQKNLCTQADNQYTFDMTLKNGRLFSYNGSPSSLFAITQLFATPKPPSQEQ